MTHERMVTVNEAMRALLVLWQREEPPEATYRMVVELLSRYREQGGTFYDDDAEIGGSG